MAKFLFFFFFLCGIVSMWGMYNVDDATQLCIAMVIMCIMGMAISCSIWEENIKKKIK